MIEFGGKIKAQYTDASGNIVAVTLSGPGSGELSFISSGSSDPVSLVLSGTTVRSALSVVVKSPKGVTNLTDVQVNGSLAKFSASKANLSGTFDVTGTLGSLTLGSVGGGSTAITVDSAGVSTIFRFGAVKDLSLISAGAIRLLSARSFTNGPFGVDAISAVSIVSMVITGDFDANLNLGSSGNALSSFRAGGAIAGGSWSLNGNAGHIASASIADNWTATIAGNLAVLTTKGTFNGSLTARSARTISVGGDLSGSTLQFTGTPASLGKTLALRTLSVAHGLLDSQVQSTGNIGSVVVGGATGSELFAGVSGALTTLPTTIADFLTPLSIKSFASRGTTPFADTLIAASTIGSVGLRNVTTANNGTPFGVAASSLATFTDTTPGNKPFAWHKSQAVSLLANLPGDLKVNIL